MQINIIEKLKGVRQIRQTFRNLKKMAAGLTVFHKRLPAYFFHSPRIAISKSFSSYIPREKALEKMTAIQNGLLEGISLHRNVLSYPIIYGKEKDYAGGLVDSRTHELIKTAIHLRGGNEPVQEFKLADYVHSTTTTPEIKQVTLYGGIMYSHFGHFMLESLGRVWAYEHVKDLDPFILFYNDMGTPRYLEKKNFIYQVLEGFNIPLKKIIFVDSLHSINLLIVPEQKYGYGFCKNPDASFLKFIHSFKLLAAIPESIKEKAKIYVSRSNRQMGKPIGENYFESFLTEEGYFIFHPERYTLNQQLAVYNEAGKIIFCDGAAIHACILLPSIKADIAVVARRRDHRWPCSSILDQFVGYRKAALWIDFVKEQYQFGLESWQALSVVDFYEVSITLKNKGFVNNPFSRFREIDLTALVRSELRSHLASIASLTEYHNFMVGLKEPLPDAD